MVTIHDIMEKLPVKVISGDRFDATVTGGYVSDLLSNVMGQAVSGNIWITMQGHQNVVAVALLAGLAAIIVAGGAQPDATAVAKAKAEGLVIMVTELSAYEVAGKLYQLGIQSP